MYSDGTVGGYAAEASQHYDNIPQDDAAHESDYEEPKARWSWNIYPKTRVEAAKLHIPLGCAWAPLDRPCPQLQSCEQCSKCKGYLNPYCRVDFRTRSWLCVLCENMNTLPMHLTEHQPPIEMCGYETVEYDFPCAEPLKTTYVFAVDCCVDTVEELEGLKRCLHLVLSKVPDDMYVCFITFGITIQIYDLSGSTAYPRIAVLRGSEEVTVDVMRKALPNMGPFIVPLSHCRHLLIQLIGELTADPWPVAKDHRPLRCTGSMLSAATSLLEISSPNRGSCIFSFLSGPCTVGPGMIVKASREQMIRGHTDIKDCTANASLWLPSCAYYDALMQRLVSHGHSMSCFCASLDQLGIGEMKQCIHCSGGVVFNTESWSQEPFLQTIALFFDSAETQFGLNVMVDAITSPSWKVAGVVGQCIGTGKKSSSVSDKEIGAGGTCQWTTGMIDSRTTFAFYFHTTGLLPKKDAPHDVSYRYVQFITRYEQQSSVRVRVTTLTHPQQETISKAELALAFDQETAAVLLARLAVHKTDFMQLYDILRWLDKKLVSLVSEFGSLTAGKGSPMNLPPQFVYFPAFLFHLRRSGYLQVFNSSPDESAIIRLQLLKSSVRDSIIQIQPTLYRYRMDQPSTPVPLDSSALQQDCIVLLDTFFEVLLHSGSAIAAWRNAGYAEQEEYSFFKEFLEVPMMDAQLLVSKRLPVPRLIDVCQDDPDARILYNRINPSRTHNSTEEGYGSSEGELVYTDDASLQVFVKQLWALASQKS